MARRFVNNRTLENDGAVVQKQVAVAGTTVTVTAETQQELDEQIGYVVRHLDESFSSGEVPENLHIDLGVELPSMGDEKAGGQSRTINGEPHLLIAPGDAPPWFYRHLITHELVHAQREKEGRGYENNHAVEEIETELEALARTPYPVLKEIIDHHDQIPGRTSYGYWKWYAAVFETDAIATMVNDRKILTGSLQRHLTGPDVARRVRQLYHMTGLGQMTSVMDFYDSLPHDFPIRTSPRRRPRLTATVSRRATKMKRGQVRRTFIVRVKKGDRTVTVDAGREIPVAAIAKSLRTGLGASAVWECRNCKMVRVA